MPQPYDFWDTINTGGRRRGTDVYEQPLTPEQIKAIQGAGKKALGGQGLPAPPPTPRGAAARERERLMEGRLLSSPARRREQERIRRAEEKRRGQAYDVSRQKFIANEKARQARIAAGTEPVTTPEGETVLPYREALRSAETVAGAKATAKADAITLRYEEMMKRDKARGLQPGTAEWDAVQSSRRDELNARLENAQTLEEAKEAGRNMRAFMDAQNTANLEAFRVQTDMFKNVPEGAPEKPEVVGAAGARSAEGVGAPAEAADQARFDLDQSGGKLSPEEQKYRKAVRITEYMAQFKDAASRQAELDKRGWTEEELIMAEETAADFRRKAKAKIGGGQ